MGGGGPGPDAGRPGCPALLPRGGRVEQADAMTGRSAAGLCLVGCIWGASYLFIRVAVNDGVPAVEIVLVRCLAGAAVLNLILAGQRSSLRSVRISPAVLLAFCLMGTVAPFLLITWAEARIASGSAAFLNATM